jgi:lipopolysaccharide/colanic/teichoic acid biosynthesis glycosyltransferase
VDRTVRVLILDHRPHFVPSGEETASLLALPLGSSSVLDQWITRILHDVDGELLIVPTFPPSPAYEQLLRRHTSYRVGILGVSDAGPAEAVPDPAESVLIVDASRWPVEEFDVRALRRRQQEFRGAVYAVGVGNDAERTRERVVCDARGFVQRVLRLYDRVSWPESALDAVFMALVPAHASFRPPPQSLRVLRSALAERGVLTRDEPVATEIIDLLHERGFLAAHERILAQTAEPDAELGFARHAAGVLVAPQARIDPSACLTGPVLIYPGARVEAGATVIGPAVVGARSVVGRGAVVVQSVLAPGATVTARASVCRRVLVGRIIEDSSGLDAPTNADSAPSPESPTLEWFRTAYTDGTLAVPRTPTGRRFQARLKRAMDVVLSVLGLLALSPVMIVAAILVKLSSPGPVLFRHRREHRGGKEFGCLKFRTMVVGADRLQRMLSQQNEVDGPQFKMRKDPRVTWIGRVLRVTNVDELPQLFNVLAGQMSLVGPRPSPFRENQICVPWRRARLSVRPGITGLWQVCRADRAESDFNQWIYYDITYVRNFSLLLDLKILAATILTLGGRWSVPVHWMIHTPHRPADSHSPIRFA